MRLHAEGGVDRQPYGTFSISYGYRKPTNCWLSAPMLEARVRQARRPTRHPPNMSNASATCNKEESGPSQRTIQRPWLPT